MPKQFTTSVINGDFDTTAGIFAQRGGRTGDGSHVGNMDGVIGADFHTTDSIGSGEFGGGFIATVGGVFRVTGIRRIATIIGLATTASGEQDTQYQKQSHKQKGSFLHFSSPN